MSQQAQGPSSEPTNFQHQFESDYEDEWDGDNWDDDDYDDWVHAEDNIHSSGNLQSSSSSAQTAGEIQHDQSTPWKYTDVTGKQGLRLLVVEPGAFDDAIHCRLVHVRTDTRLEYEAISYTWADESGDATKSKTISISGTPFAVTANCEAVLRRVRRLSTPRIVWIDAVCINQENKDEQGHQVQLMPDIYSRARRVLIYLGEPLDDEHEGLKRLDNVRATAGRFPTEEDDRNSGTRVRESISRAMLSLFRRRYFSRVWILQEVALAREGVVVCGRYEASWEHLRDNATSMASSFVQEWRSFPLPRVVTLAPRKFRDSSSLLDLLDNARDSHATDPRDKIFAVFGMIQCAPTLGFIADYNSSVEDVYIETALNIAEMHGVENLLMRALGFRNHQTLPAWVPDWSAPVVRELGELVRLIKKPHAECSVLTRPSVDRGQRCIELDVVRVGTLKSLLDGLLTPDFEFFLSNRDTFVLKAADRKDKWHGYLFEKLQKFSCYSLVYSSSRSMMQSVLYPHGRKWLLLLSSSETVFSFAGVCVIRGTRHEWLEREVLKIARGFRDRLRDEISATTTQPEPAQGTAQSMSFESIGKAIDSMISFMLGPPEKAMDLNRRQSWPVPTREHLNEENIIRDRELAQHIIREEDIRAELREFSDDGFPRGKSETGNFKTPLEIIDALFVRERFGVWLRRADGKRLAALLSGSSEKTQKAWNLVEERLVSNPVLWRTVLGPERELVLPETSSRLPRTRARLEVGGA
ncbi:heterokaryon incompatibility protein-domain-containing protein [Cladorrhinum samala]|uniref:Heterokaryon incompatibility protein-domain-containing protein n=1 Tax=Cladorrhinum samala TaxID=585594 RepID=A0AAV9HVM3_9PEZI|nr:heterokaryon incompatibility protein-domain-containing protein [Cladorrhinum samala]